IVLRGAIFVGLVSAAAPSAPAVSAAPTVFFARPVLVDVGERGGHLAIEALGDLAHRADARPVSVLEVAPSQPALGVFVVEEVDQPIWPLRGRLRVHRYDRRREVRPDAR